MSNIKEKEETNVDLFVKEYSELCDKFGMEIGYQPSWKQSADTGTWSVVIQPVLVKRPEVSK